MTVPFRHSTPLPTEAVVALRHGTRSEPHRVSEVFRIVPTVRVPQTAREAQRTGTGIRNGIQRRRTDTLLPPFAECLDGQPVQLRIEGSLDGPQTNPTPLRMAAAGRP